MFTGSPLHLLARCTVLAMLLALGACVYRINIQQGNYLDPKALEQLQPGMTRSQVRFLLGTPMVADAFDPDRWDYVYYFKRGRLREPEKRKVTVYFEEDAVVRIDRPGDPPKDRVAQESESQQRTEAVIAEEKQRETEQEQDKPN